MVFELKKLHEDAKLPVLSSDEAGGFDIFVNRIEYVDAGFVICHTDIAVDLVGHKALMMPRSNLTKHPWVLSNSVAVIDADFRGGIQARFRALPHYISEGNDPFGNVKLSDQPSPFPYQEGDRVAQLVIVDNPTHDFVEVNELSDTKRGDGGFGSTGLR